MIGFIVQKMIKIIFTVTISYCCGFLFGFIFAQPNNDQDHDEEEVEDDNDNSEDIKKINEELENMKQKMEKQNMKFEEVIQEVQIAAITAKIRDTKLEILEKCATINEKIVDYLHTEGK